MLAVFAESALVNVLLPTLARRLPTPSLPHSPPTFRPHSSLTLFQSAGDIVQIAGMATPVPTSTLAAPSITRPLFAVPLDPPTLSMCFGVNDSHLGGREGSLLTGTMISERLQKEAAANISLQVMPAVAQEGMPDAVEVRGRGELQMAVLIENMRREGFELSVSPPAVLFKEDSDGGKLEPYEHVVIDVDEAHSGMVIERMAGRKGQLDEFIQMGGEGKVRGTEVCWPNAAHAHTGHTRPSSTSSDHTSSPHYPTLSLPLPAGTPDLQGTLPRPHRLPVRAQDRVSGLRSHAPRVRLVRPLHPGARPQATRGHGVQRLRPDHGVRAGLAAGESWSRPTVCTR